MGLETFIKDSDWFEFLKDDFESENFKNIKQNLKKAKEIGEVYPPDELIFNAFNLTNLNDVKVIILGQDPYHGTSQAMGLSFSVPSGVKIPPSLVNIFKELSSDIGVKPLASGELTHWAKQGVLLLNSTLSVQAHKPNSHKNFGWQEFTDSVISKLSSTKKNLVFMLWGNYAKSKSNLIDSSSHLILTAAHPSPLARGAFFGSKHFSQANHYLKIHGKTQINWA